MAAAAAAMAIAAPAQQTIIFSKPSDLPANKANSFLPGSDHRVNAGDYNAPRQLFNDFTPDLPMPKPAQMNNNNSASVKEALDKRKNWTLLTPEQILGIQTPEQILGMPDKPGEKKLSLEEQFLLRESQTTAFAATNGRAGPAAFWHESTDVNPFELKNKNDENDPFRRGPQKMEPGTKFFNQLLNAQDSGSGPEAKPNSPWNSAFAQPNQPKQTPEQIAAMESFRAMLEPPAPPATPPVPTRFSVAVQPKPDPFLQPVPVVNPVGHAIEPLENIFTRPAGIKPLPGISTPPPTPAATKSAAQPQLPPWMRDGPPAHNGSQNY